MSSSEDDNNNTKTRDEWLEKNAPWFHSAKQVQQQKQEEQSKTPIGDCSRCKRRGLYGWIMDKEKNIRRGFLYRKTQHFCDFCMKELDIGSGEI